MSKALSAALTQSLSEAVAQAAMDFRKRCRDCGEPLSLEEDHYYEYRCESCEGKWFARVVNWVSGADDPELEAMFGP